MSNFNETFDAPSGVGTVALGSAQLVVGITNGTGTFPEVFNGLGDLLKEGTDQSTTLVGFNIGSNGTATAYGVDHARWFLY